MLRHLCCIFAECFRSLRNESLFHQPQHPPFIKPLQRFSVKHPWLPILCSKNMPSMSPRPSPLARLPRWVSHWLGYRAGPVPKQPDYIIWIWSFIGAFGGLSILQAIFGHSHYFLQRDVPSIIASYGASAVLCYGAIEAPLAQPRALMGGHFISALTGVCITKLFGLLPTEQRLDQLRWLAGSLSSATAIVLMQMTTTTHPPAGATALLAAVSPEVYVMGWYYLPVVLLSSTMVLISALLVNNIQRRYPVFWFTPSPPAAPAPAPAAATREPELIVENADLEKGFGTPSSTD